MPSGPVRGLREHGELCATWALVTVWTIYTGKSDLLMKADHYELLSSAQGFLASLLASGLYRESQTSISAFVTRMRTLEAPGSRIAILDARVVCQHSIFCHLTGRFITDMGFSSDIPAHTYQATFEPNGEWSTFYASAPEIHGYWKRLVDKYGCMKHSKLRQRVSDAACDEENSK